MTNQTLLTLAVTARGSAEHLTRLLVSVLHQSIFQRAEPPKIEIRLALKALNPKLKNILDRMPLPIITTVSPEKNPCARRNQLYAQAEGQFVYFLDEDCCLPNPYFLDEVLRLLTGHPNRLMLGGPYLDPRNSRSWVRSSNALANCWLEQNAQAEDPVILAGNFLMAKVETNTPEHFPFPQEAEFGGEEILLKNYLLAMGWQFQVSTRLGVLHFAAPTARRFFARAWLHGGSAHTYARPAHKTWSFLSRLSKIQGLKIQMQMLAFMVLERFSSLWHQLQRLPLLPREQK